MMSHFYVKTRIRFSLRDKRLFEITEVEITRIDCIVRKMTHIQQFHIIKNTQYDLCYVKSDLMPHEPDYFS